MGIGCVLIGDGFQNNHCYGEFHSVYSNTLSLSRRVMFERHNFCVILLLETFSKTPKVLEGYPTSL